jgi:hypothetical protein
MKTISIFFLLILSSSQTFCQSLKEKNRKLELERDSLEEIAEYLFFQQITLKDSVNKSEKENKMFVLGLLALYNETEDKKLELYHLINETNDSLIDWSKFYRYGEISLNQMTAYWDTLESHRKEIALKHLKMDFSEWKRRTSKQQNEFLTQQIAFFNEAIPSFKKIITQLENQLAIQQIDSLKLVSWQKIILRTRDYCLGKSDSLPFKLGSKYGWICGAIDEEELNSKIFSDPPKKMEKPYEEIPIFPGGLGALNSYLNLEVYKAAIKSEDPDLKKIYVKFTVTDNGEIRNPLIINGPDCFQCNKAVLKIVQDMPQWIPATKGGHPVSFEFRLPVKIN